ncbi:hypothetical protein C7W88_16095 [Novosphingobium sp. THN1]|nr:hypothetical protein C7W88_16095 [Novosphingobium sp. THN1]
MRYASVADFAADRFLCQPPHVAFSACFFDGEGDGIMPFDWGLRIARRNSPGRSLLFPLTGRWALAEQPDCAGKITPTFPDGKTIGDAAQYVGAC